MKKDSEFRAYVWIINRLKGLGWDCRNPSRGGMVYTQHECRADEEIKACLGGAVPENIIKVREGVFWVIEAKASHSELGKALREAKEYAKKINKSQRIQARFISGVAGTESSMFLVDTEYWDGRRFRPVTLNGRPITSLMTPQIAGDVIDKSSPDIQDIHISRGLFLSVAEKINGILHDAGINLKDRAQVMSALLLALLDDTSPNLDASPTVFIREINARTERILVDQGKPTYFPYVELKLPATSDNHLKYKSALVKTIQELNDLNIRSAMNSGADILGEFYEVFLKYGNGAKEIGIVLTPRHITTFVADVMNITAKDVLYDPCCGTGGFLVAGFDYARKNSRKADLDNFKQNNIWGIDQDTPVVTLAIVNMIFRGDGKNNITEGNCLHKHIAKSNGCGEYSNIPATSDEEKIVTKVLMNPPFPTSKGQNKEYDFVDSALLQMQDHGLLFSVLPYPTLVKAGRYRTWRRDKLLRENTLLSVVTLPPDLFYPVGTHTVGVFVRKGISHPPEQHVLWIRAVNDGLLKSKGKRLPNERAKNDYPEIRSMLSQFLQDPTIKIESREMFFKCCPIDNSDPNFELVPEYYLDQSSPTIQEVQRGVEQIVRDAAAFLVREGIE